MKRLITLLLILMLPVAALASDLPDFPSMDDAQLQQLNSALQLELFNRSVTGPDGVLVPAGEWVIGEDIPAGVYRLVFASNYGEMQLYEAVSYNGETQDLMTVLQNIGPALGVPEIGKLDLSPYTKIVLTLPATFYTYTGLFK